MAPPIRGSVRRPSTARALPAQAFAPLAFAALTFALLATASSSLAGQTPATASGLGYPVPPIDARAAALGGTGIGLLGGTFSLRNPADLTEHQNAGISTSLAPESLTLEFADGSADTGRNRFSVVRWVLPLEDWSLGFGFGSELDQDWDVRMVDTLRVSAGDFPFEEVHRHDGGVSTIDLSVARRLGPLSVGASGQRLTGSLRQTFARRFEAGTQDPDAGTGTPPNLQDVAAERRIRYGAWRLRAGASLQPIDRVRLSGAVSWATSLDVEPENPEEPSRSFDMPASVEVGGSAQLFPALLVTAAGGWTGWSTVGEVQPGTTSHDTRWAGAGLELTGWRALGADVPFRVGGRVTELPFGPAGMDQAVERAFTFGFGARFGGGRADLDTGIEIGRRGDLPATGFEEAFRRVTFTFAVRP